jgi:hypothetical protein
MVLYLVEHWVGCWEYSKAVQKELHSVVKKVASMVGSMVGHSAHCWVDQKADLRVVPKVSHSVDRKAGRKVVMKVCYWADLMVVHSVVERVA